MSDSWHQRKYVYVHNGKNVKPTWKNNFFQATFGSNALRSQGLSAMFHTRDPAESTTKMIQKKIFRLGYKITGK